MPERKIEVPFMGRVVQGTEVPIKESSTHANEYTLSDGTVIRIQLAVASVTRIDGEYDPEGNPWYAVKSQPIITILSIPKDLRRKLQ
jgi:hypothetical protein